MTIVENLHEFENGTFTVKDILMAYFGAENENELINSFEDDDTMLDYWADCNNLEDATQMFDLINVKLDQKAKFKVLAEEGSGGGWLECELTLCDGISLGMDWVTDED